jgi:uncharacterized protein
VWQRSRDGAQRPSAPLRTGVPQGPERTALCMVWKAQRGAAVMWLCGSIHTLRAEDYPLPAPYLTALNEAKRVVMELPPDYTPGTAMRALGTLRAGRTLKDALSAETWSALGEWSTRRRVSLTAVEGLKPWAAALSVTHTAQSARGFHPEAGMEPWLRARLGSKLAEGLETPEGQLGIFDSLTPQDQEKMLALTLQQDAAGVSNIDRMAVAWREGRAATLAQILDEESAGLPDLKRRLHADRHRAWLPRLETLLAGSETVMVMVGSAHLAGPESLVAMLAEKGATLTQQEYRTTRLAMQDGPAVPNP